MYLKLFKNYNQNFLENVKNLKPHKNEETFATILNKLIDLRYTSNSKL